MELGCGTAYISAWLAKRGARPVGVDPTPAQLETARRMMRETGIEFPLLQAPGESVPLPDASFDLAISEYGACLWADPYEWIPEATRLLRPDTSTQGPRSGGGLAFSGSSGRRRMPLLLGRGQPRPHIRSKVMQDDAAACRCDRRGPALLMSQGRCQSPTQASALR